MLPFGLLLANFAFAADTTEEIFLSTDIEIEGFKWYGTLDSNQNIIFEGGPNLVKAITIGNSVTPSTALPKPRCLGPEDGKFWGYQASGSQNINEDMKRLTFEDFLVIGDTEICNDDAIACVVSSKTDKVLKAMVEGVQNIMKSMESLVDACKAEEERLMKEDSPTTNPCRNVDVDLKKSFGIEKWNKTGKCTKLDLDTKIKNIDAYNMLTTSGTPITGIPKYKMLAKKAAIQGFFKAGGVCLKVSENNENNEKIDPETCTVRSMYTLNAIYQGSSSANLIVISAILAFGLFALLGFALTKAVMGCKGRTNNNLV